jgi:4-hydroxybenzoate polyprenyltransferase
MALARLLRPKQWAKNLLVFAALLFTGGWDRTGALLLACGAFFAMSLLSSAVYVLNDLRDRERDRAHPVKRNRPLASGAVSPGSAATLGLVCLVGAAGLFFWLGPACLAIGLTYLVIQVLYNFGLKRVPVLDVFLLATGFVLRAALGAAAIGVTISAWLLFCTAALALLLGFGKRRHEFLLQGEARETSRESLGGYTREALDGLVLVAAAIAAICYGIYAIDSPTAVRYPALLLTAPFVLYGIARYLFLILSRTEGGEPESMLLGDPHMLLSVALFVIAAAAAVGGLRLPLLEGAR